MPAVKYYEVEQTRTVKVWANSATEAALVADDAFAKARSEDVSPLPEELQGRVIGLIEVTRLDITKEY